MTMMETLVEFMQKGMKLSNTIVGYALLSMTLLEID